jgi:threonine dehydrogenase-like Zn-dependent dehydrogenase
VDVTVVDPNPARAAVADTLGLRCVTKPPVDTEADVVIHASGRPEGLVAALSLAGTEATIVEASWYGTREVPLPLGERFHARRLTLRSSQVGRLSPAQVPRWTHGRRLALALTLLRASELDVLISGESRFTELPTVMAALTREPGDTLCHRIRYES